ncbi:hypothetical protein GA610_03925 [Bifidobacterium adolescentis]|nr:hypothetical protein GA610_03925 [Bifidobacterium adolescentis]KAB5922584.1 hypothetical protein GA617_07230 [Bifidobacterium adolescentis]
MVAHAGAQLRAVDLQRHGRLYRQVRARQLQSDRRDRSGDSDPHGLIGLPFAGPLVARFGKRNASMAGLVLVAVGSLLVFVDPSNLWVFFVSIIVRMVGIIPMNAALNAMSGDVVEYGEWRSGVRSDGIVFSSSSFSMKVAMGVSSAAIAWILGASGYDGSLAVRSDATVSAMVNTFVWVPVAMVVVMAALLFFYDLDKRVDRVGGELAARRV